MIVLLRSMDQSAVLYLNGFFPRRFSMLAIFLQRLGLIHPGCLVLAPRGEFSPGALQIKKTRKMLYIVLSRLLGLYRGVIWHASTELERADVLECFRRAVISIAGVIPQTRESQERLTRSVALPRRDIGEQPGTTERTRPQKISGHLCIVFVSRISPMKNLLTALRILQGVSGDVAFDIYGPAEDAGYWNKCKTVIGTLPANVRVQYIGEVEHDRVSDVFAEYDLFLFPTLGENYGHVIYESLAAGCPVLISDRTPWRELQDAGVGWDIPIDDTERFTTILQQCVDADDESYAAFRARAKEYAERFVANPEVVEANRKLFKNAVAAATE
jgi:glycosyltransferase involved in cell wall biosynthesis